MDEIMNRLNSIEMIIKEMYKEVLDIKTEMSYKSLEQFHVMTRLENIADFIKDRYDVLVEEKEKFNVENMEKRE